MLKIPVRKIPRVFFIHYTIHPISPIKEIGCVRHSQLSHSVLQAEFLIPLSQNHFRDFSYLTSYAIRFYVHNIYNIIPNLFHITYQ